MGAEYGKAPIEDTLDFWQADDAEQTEWSLYQFEYDDDDEPVFTAFAEKADDGSWDADVNPRFAMEAPRRQRFDDLEAAKEWCCSWAFCPERGQGTYEYEPVTLDSSTTRDLARMCERRFSLIQACGNNLLALQYNAEAIADIIVAETYLKTVHVCQLPRSVQNEIRGWLEQALRPQYPDEKTLAEFVETGMNERLCNLEDTISVPYRHIWKALCATAVAS